MHNIDVMPDASEIVHYDVSGIPLYVRRGQLSAYPKMRAICHWHEDLEFIHVTEGEMSYFIGGHTVQLAAGDTLFVNARQMHYGYASHGQECLFLCILVHPSLLVANELLHAQFIRPLIADESFSHMVFRGSDTASSPFTLCMMRAFALKDAAVWGNQITIINDLVPLVLHIARRRMDRTDYGTLHTDGRLLAQKQMVAHIAAHYTEELSLEEIAASASVSKSTCCRIFKSYIHQSPFEYLNTYRLEQSRYLLTGTGKSVTEIATLCGFNSASYYSKLFHRNYGTSPLAYRKEATRQEI